MSSNNGEFYGYIPDGYTTGGYIRGVAGLYPDVRFKYRPLQRLQRERVRRELAEQLSAMAIDKLQYVYAELIRRQVIEWDIRKNRRETVPLERDEILRIQPELFEQLILVIMGQRACDVPPTDTPEVALPGNDDPGALLDAALTGESLETVLEKN